MRRLAPTLRATTARRIEMQAQQEFRINAAPLTATFVLLVGLALGAIGGYAIGAAERSITPVIPLVTPVKPSMRFPAATQPPVREPQNSYD
jgi:hypothetical protein